MSEGHDSPFLRAFPKDNFVLTHYMISGWWLHLLGGIGHYLIRPGAVAHIMVMTNNIINLCYTYDKRRLKIPLTFSAKFHTPAD